MHQYECIVQFGHMGAGKNLEQSILVWASNICQAMQLAKSLPGVKKGAMKRSGASVLKVSLLQS
jgi:hypothetical protein